MCEAFLLVLIIPDCRVSFSSKLFNLTKWTGYSWTERLSGLVILCFQNERAEKLNLEQIAEDFVAHKTRRMKSRQVSVTKLCSTHFAVICVFVGCRYCEVAVIHKSLLSALLMLDSAWLAGCLIIMLVALAAALFNYLSFLCSYLSFVLLSS